MHGLIENVKIVPGHLWKHRFSTNWPYDRSLAIKSSEIAAVNVHLFCRMIHHVCTVLLRTLVKTIYISGTYG